MVSGAGVLGWREAAHKPETCTWSETGPWCSFREDLLPNAGCRGQQTAPFTVNLNFSSTPSQVFTPKLPGTPNSEDPNR